MAAEGYRRHVAFMRAGLPKRASRTAKLAAAMQGYVRFAQEHPHLFALMFSSDLCDLDDAELQTAGAESYGVLREISAGLDWDKADKPHADLRAETMIWSLVHGFAQLSNSGMLSTAPDGSALPALSVHRCGAGLQIPFVGKKDRQRGSRPTGVESQWRQAPCHTPTCLPCSSTTPPASPRSTTPTRPKAAN